MALSKNDDENRKGRGKEKKELEELAEMADFFKDNPIKFRKDDIVKLPNNMYTNLPIAREESGEKLQTIKSPGQNWNEQQKRDVLEKEYYCLRVVCGFYERS